MKRSSNNSIYHERFQLNVPLKKPDNVMCTYQFLISTFRFELNIFLLYIIDDDAIQFDSIDLKVSNQIHRTITILLEKVTMIFNFFLTSDY